MIIKNIKEMSTLVEKMEELINLDIEDIKAARHEKLLDRNEEKQEIMDNIVQLKEELNNILVEQMQNGIDINIYRADVDSFENKLKDLHKLNAKLASIVLPIKQMYKDIVDELSDKNGGNLIEIKV